MQDVHQRELGAITLYYEDNEEAIKLANNPMAPNSTKHIDIKHHYIRELLDARTIAVVSMGTLCMFANGLTKALPEPKHTTIFKRCMGAAPSGDKFACNDLEGLLHYIIITTGTFTIVNVIGEYV
jgi:hypothetical protein